MGSDSGLFCASSLLIEFVIRMKVERGAGISTQSRLAMSAFISLPRGHLPDEAER